MPCSFIVHAIQLTCSCPCRWSRRTRSSSKSYGAWEADGIKSAGHAARDGKRSRRGDHLPPLHYNFGCGCCTCRGCCYLSPTTALPCRSQISYVLVASGRAAALNFFVLVVVPRYIDRRAVGRILLEGKQGKYKGLQSRRTRPATRTVHPRGKNKKLQKYKKPRHAYKIRHLGR